MLYVILADGTRIDDCAAGTTSDNIIHTGETYAEAAEIMDVITPENAVAVRVFNAEDDTEVAFGGSLVLNDGGTLGEFGGVKTCTVTLRHKTEMEVLNERISDLEDVVLDA